MRKFFLFLYIFIVLLSINEVRVSYAAENSGLDSSALFFSSGDEVKLPVVMYHLVTRNDKYIGRYGITPEALESDLKYLSENGYGTVVMQDVLEFVNNGAPLPDKPVMLTFDDGNSGDYTYLFPLLKKYKMTAILSVIGKPTDKYTGCSAKHPGASYPNLIWPQLKEMVTSGAVEIQSHSYDLHGRGGIGMRSGETTDVYKERLRKDFTRLQERCAEELKIKPNTFTYPLGIFNKNSEKLLGEMGFAASFSCTEGINIIKRGKPERLFLLKRCIRPTGKNIGEVLSGCLK